MTRADWRFVAHHVALKIAATAYVVVACGALHGSAWLARRGT